MVRTDVSVTGNIRTTSLQEGGRPKFMIRGKCRFKFVEKESIHKNWRLEGLIRFVTKINGSGYGKNNLPNH